MTILRPSVQRFAETMEENLCRNDFKGGWGDMNSYEILGRIWQEVDELKQAIRNARVKDGPVEPVLREAADVANFCMFLADNHECLAPQKREP